VNKAQEHLYGPMVTMYDEDGRPSVYAQNPTAGSAVRFLTTVHAEQIRYGWVAILTDVGPNLASEIVIVTDDKGPRKVYFLNQIQSWSEVWTLPPK
jgi:hypothetical protein